MNLRLLLTLLCTASLLTACLSAPPTPTPAVLSPAPAPASTPVPPQADPAYTVTSPDGTIVVTVTLSDGVPYYAVAVAGQLLVTPSRLGLELKNAPPLGEGVRVLTSTLTTHDETWEQPWGETRFIRDHHNQLHLTLVEAAPAARQLGLVFRVFDDGVGLRYEVPAHPDLAEFTLTDERTEFNFTADHTTWSIPAFQGNRYEYLYARTSLSRLRLGAHTPMTLYAADSGLYVAVHEAALVDYAAMTLQRVDTTRLKARLVPWANGDLVYATAPMRTPWRTLQIARRPADLITSYLVLNLNEPNQLGEVGWVQPGKYVGIWWGMHLGQYTWGSGPQHGATTTRTLKYMDFAAANGFRGVLVEGWNLGWDGNWGSNGHNFNFTTAYPDFDLPAVAAYAQARGVRLIGHHETGAAITNYDNQMEAAFALYASLGVDTVKTGYVGTRVTGNQWHHGQYMVRHYQKVIDTAARYRIAINAHEPIKDTGLRRTYPNFLSREGARGAEYDAWGVDGGNPPNHVPTLIFTRLLAGPMDYTPGLFDLRYPEWQANNQVNTTLAKQLACYVVIYSPVQMAADLPENYADQPGFQFIRDVPVDWENTLAVDGAIGEFAVIARQERGGRDWYVGAVTNENPRSLTVPLNFLEPGITYQATLYVDGPAAHWNDNPFPLNILTQTVTAQDSLTLDLAAGGGAAVRLAPRP